MLLGLIKTPKAIVNRRVRKIHRSFEIAADSALAEARAIIATTSSIDLSKKIQLLNQMGFDSCSTVQKGHKNGAAKLKAKTRSEIVTKYANKYPQYKFIFIDQVEALCNKYKLVCGQVGRYIGDIPDKNIQEIAAFKVTDEDIYMCRGYGYHDIEKIDITNNDHLSVFQPLNSVNSYVSHTKMPLYICAPPSQMKTTKGTLMKKGVFMYEDPDPIVLHFVKDGFLIVSKWGVEGEDPALVNEKMN